MPLKIDEEGADSGHVYKKTLLDNSLQILRKWELLWELSELLSCPRVGKIGIVTVNNADLFLKNNNNLQNLGSGFGRR